MSFFVTPKSAREGAPVQKTYVDVLYDHAGYLRANGGKLGPGSLSGKKVCVVGGGPAGLATAYLLRLQNASVSLYEATQRIGGRVDTQHPVSNDPACFEMGAMRVPPSEQLFGYFWNEIFNLPAPTVFPDPGKVDTKIVFQNQVYDWPAGGNPPAIFTNVSKGWNAFAGSPTLQSIATSLCDARTFGQAKTLWQPLIYQAGAPLGPEQGYSTISFFQGLVQAFVENYAKYGCEKWSSRDFALFGALGLGSGGFGPLYQVNFSEIVRLVVNGLETNQQFYAAGLSRLTDAFANALPAGTIQPQRRVTAVTPHGGLEHPVRVFSVDASGTQHSEYFDAVVIATTTRSMQVDMDITEPPPAGVSAQEASETGAVGTGRLKMPITNDQATAVQELHLMNSSKLFVLTQTKFWQGTNMPQNIQTDGLVRGLYCLDYPNSNYGVVLVSYTWGDDSTKYIAIKDPNERFDLLLRSLSPYADLAPFVTALRSQALRQHTTLIDWQDERQYYGAFKLNYPGQDGFNQSLYYQFLSSQNGVFLAGDSVGFCGGWIEGALQTAMNATAAIVQRFCGVGGLAPNNPMMQNATQYSYGP
jgi:tryptophan 2-monooxygenase